MEVTLNSVEKVSAFVNLVSKVEDDIDLVSGRYVVDAKSILGIFSLDLSKPIKVEFNGSKNQGDIKKMLCAFLAE
jgi:phosphocarrier protein HPr